MKPEAQRIAIAQACGWKNVHGFDKWKDGGPVAYKDGDLVGDFKGRLIRHLPNYLNDLNAMHEAENRLKHEDPHSFACYASDLFEEHGSDAIHLSAAQRAEAFLRTLNLWQE